MAHFHPDNVIVTDLIALASKNIFLIFWNYLESLGNEPATVTVPGPVRTRLLLETVLVIRSRASIANDQFTTLEAFEALIHVNRLMNRMALARLEMRRTDNILPAY